MELRKLKALLGALQAAGVTSFHEGDLTLTFGAPPMEVPRGDVEVDETWANAGRLSPDALTATLDRIRSKYEQKGKRS